MSKKRARQDLTVTGRFGLVIEQSDRLARRRLLLTGLNTNLVITAGGGPVTVTWSQPDEEDFHAFLVDLRPFISDREPVFLNTIYNLIDLHVTDPKLRDEARRSREILRDVEAGTDLHRPDRSPAQIADAYIDGTFHVDTGARELTERRDGPLDDLNLWFVHSYCAGVALRVAEVASILRRAIAGEAMTETAVTHT